jgi:hypothetical protein
MINWFKGTVQKNNGVLEVEADLKSQWKTSGDPQSWELL